MDLRRSHSHSIRQSLRKDASLMNMSQNFESPKQKNAQRKEDKFSWSVKKLYMNLANVKEEPKLKECWRWIKGVVIEYKQQKEIIHDLCTLLSVEPGQVLQEIQNLIKLLFTMKMR